jgi:hypothetical protein
MNQEWVTQAARDFAAKHLAECELMEEGLAVIIDYDQSRLRYAAIRHTDLQPYCDDESCPCHEDMFNYGECILTPFMDGLMTFSEANALRWGENI